jgi:hypothetical protein
MSKGNNIINSSVNYFSSDTEKKVWQQRKALLDDCPLPDNEMLNNLGLFLSSKNLSRILFFDHIYRQILDVQGIVVEFGTRWGQNISLMSALRGIYEPFNRLRTFIAFDTFTGLSECVEKDRGRKEKYFKKGDLAVSEGYENYLDEIMSLHELENPLSHLKKYEIIKGDAIETFAKYLKDHPEAIVSLAYFDMDIYKPTVECLKLLKDRLVKGSVVGFDELNDPLSPGETIALHEVFGLNSIRLKRYPYASRVSYFVVE